MKRVHSICIAAIGIVILQASVPTSAKTQIYMATDGDDQASGKSAHRNERGDGPVRTFDRAVELLRARKAAQGRDGAPYSIKLAAGIYRIDHTIHLDDRDSGFPGSPTAIEPLGDGEVTISGGYPLDGRIAGNIWTASLPSWAPETLVQFFIDGQRRMPAATPDIGALAGTYSISGNRAFIDLDQQAPSLDLSHGNEDVALVFAKWSTARFVGPQIDSTRRVVTLPLPLPTYLVKPGDRVALKFYAANNPVVSAARFSTDISRDKINYRLNPGEKVITDAVVPAVQVLLEIKGRVEPARYIEVNRVTFSYSSSAAKRPMESTPQAEVNQTGAINIASASNIALTGIAVTHTGGAAVVARTNVAGIVIEGCELADIGAGGILVGDPADRGLGNSSARPHDITIRECSIRGFGRISPAAAGIWLGNSAAVDISDNSVSDGYYTGISAGWSWGMKGTSLDHVRITDNRVSNIGFGLLSDMGGIYTLGVTSGDTLVTGNIIDGVHAGIYGGWGLYADEGTSNVIFADNIVLNTSSEAVHLHFGDRNIIRGNYLEGGRGGVLCAIKPDFTKTVFEGNLIITKIQNPWGWGCVQAGFQIKSDNRIRPPSPASLSSIVSLPREYQTIAVAAGRHTPLQLTVGLPPIPGAF
jgi:hypothetical protein